MRRKSALWKRVVAFALSLLLAIQVVPNDVYTVLASNISEAAENDLVLDNSYIRVDVSKKNGGFAIYTTEGDRVTKSDNNKMLLFHSDEDDTSFTSFQVTRGTDVKEYIFGGKYSGSSKVNVTEANGEIKAVWSVDDITFTQFISLVNSGSTDHGTVNISYTAENSGAPAEIKARVLLDTALGYQDYAYYNIGESLMVEQEKTVTLQGKSFYAVDNLLNPTIVAYNLNGSVNNVECKPYQTTFAHWNNLAATVFDYTPDAAMTFTNEYNKKYLTADSAVAQYYDMGTVATDGEATIATNYGIYSNETVKEQATVAVNIAAPTAMNLTADKKSFTNDGFFNATTSIKNIGEEDYERVRVVLYTTGGIEVVTSDGQPTGADYDNPYTLEFDNFKAGQTQTTTWYFKATPQTEGVYGKIHYKVYDVSSDKTLNTGDILAENYLGEGRGYVLCPGSVEGIPKIQFTSSSPEILYVDGVRNFNVTGKNFTMLNGQLESGAVKLTLSRVDGQKLNGKSALDIPSSHVSIDETKNTMSIVMNGEAPGRLPEGQYQFTFDYTDQNIEDITAEALKFAALDDPRYRNDAYGLLAVVAEGPNNDRSYTVKTYLNEEAYKNALTEGSVKRENVLLEFRGRFTSEKEGSEITYTGISLGKNDNVMTLNNCLDIEDGSTIIREENGSIKVDFDANIYTTGARTEVWSGVCALTELEKGEEYALITYEESGDRDMDAMSGKETITLLWPSVGQAAQNLLGLLLDFKYGELGVIRHENGEETRVVAFGASMDLSFLVPASSRSKGQPGNSLTDAHSQALQSGNMRANDLRSINNRIPYDSNTANTNATSPTGVEMGTDSGAAGGTATGGDGDSRSACIQVDDVLFGGKYLGVNLSVALGLPSYINGTPAMEAMLTVKTVGDWSFAVSGVVDFTLFYMEAEIAIKSKNNAPIPDTLRFFIGGVIPGINVDGFGVLWIQGAGGGISNLYDTIFLTDSVPPLQLIIEAQLSLMQVISARAKLMLSLRGIGLEINDGKLANFLVVLQSANLQFNWYPEFYFMASANINILDAITGGGYIVVEESGFFEFFVKAALSIPSSIPLIGGIQLAGAGIGVNNERLWGQIEALGLTVGVVYYWGGDINWGGGSEVAPTYPSLLGVEAVGTVVSQDVPVYYDEANNRTLYMRTGTNVVNSVKTVVSNTGSTPKINLTSTKAGETWLMTDLFGTEHTLKLGQKTKDEVLMLEWDAESLEAAERYVKNGNVKITSDSGTYNITLLNHNKDAEGQEDANANVSYDEKTKKATLAVSFADDKYFNNTWTITTKDYTSVVLYDLEPLPELYKEETKIEVKTASEAEMTVKGYDLAKFDSLTVLGVPVEDTSVGTFLSKLPFGKQLKNVFAKQSTEENPDEARLLYKIQKSDPAYADIFANNGGQFTFDLPADMSSGTYNIQIVASDEAGKYYSHVDEQIVYTNPEQSKPVDDISVENGGDYTLDVTVEDNNADFDGYEITAYDKDKNPVRGVNGLMYLADGTEVTYDDAGNIVMNNSAEKKAEITIGGQYMTPHELTEEEIQSGKYDDVMYDGVNADGDSCKYIDQLVGFASGEKYTIGVRTWKVVTDNASGSARQVFLYSDEVISDSIKVEKPVETTWETDISSKATIIEEIRGSGDDQAVFETPVYGTNNLELTFRGSNKIVGEWVLDAGIKEGTTGEVKELTKEIKLTLKDLEEGTHTFEFRGKNEHGDSVVYTYTFGVDTLAPRMMIESPLSGSVYDSKKITIEGITDVGSLITVRNKTTDEVLVDNKEVTVDKDGRFAIAAELDEALVTQKLEVSMTDAVGNTVTQDISFISGKLGNIEELLIWDEKADKEVTNLNLEPGKTYEFTVKARLADGSLITLSDMDLIEWQALTAEGSIEIQQENGYIQVKVSEDAQGMIKVRFLVSSRGTYSVVTSFGGTVDRNQPVEGEAEDDTTGGDSSEDFKDETDTGDDTPVTMWLWAAVLSMAAAVAVMSEKRKKRRE